MNRTNRHPISVTYDIRVEEPGKLTPGIFDYLVNGLAARLLAYYQDASDSFKSADVKLIIHAAGVERKKFDLAMLPHLVLELDISGHVNDSPVSMNHIIEFPLDVDLETIQQKKSGFGKVLDSLAPFEELQKADYWDTGPLTIFEDFAHTYDHHITSSLIPLFEKSDELAGRSTSDQSLTGFVVKWGVLLGLAIALVASGILYTMLDDRSTNGMKSFVAFFWFLFFGVLSVLGSVSALAVATPNRRFLSADGQKLLKFVGVQSPMQMKAVLTLAAIVSFGTLGYLFSMALGPD